MRVKVLADPFYAVFRIGGIYEAARAENDKGYMVRADNGCPLFLWDREVEPVRLTVVPTNGIDY